MAHPELLQKIQSTLPNPQTTLLSALERYIGGESMQVLAKELSITREGLRKQFKRLMLSYTGSDESYNNLITQALVDRVADADDMLEECTDPVGIARAREMARFARMDLERRRPKLYGQKQEIQTDNTIRVIIDDRSPLPVTPYIDVQPAIMSPVSEVIDNQEEEED